MHTPPLATVLLFAALLAAVSMPHGAMHSDARPAPPPPGQQREDLHPTSPFGPAPGVLRRDA